MLILLRLRAVPFRFHGLYAIGCIFFIFNIVLFVFNTIVMTIRFIKFRDTFRASLLHPTESLFVPASIISCGTIILNVNEYGLSKCGPWLDKTAMIFFWIYCALAFVSSAGIYLVL